MGVMNKLQFRTKQELAYFEIRKAIIKGDLAPGERLVIYNLARELDVSESPVREALKRLVSENFVVEQGNALYVAPLSEQQFLDMLDVRLELERIAIRRAAENINEEGVQKLKQDLEKMKQALQQENLADYFVFHKNFHNNCFIYCKVPYLVRALIDASDHHDRGISIFHLIPWREKPNFEEHEELLKALEKHDKEEAERILANNRSRAFNLYYQKLKESKNEKEKKEV